MGHRILLTLTPRWQSIVPTLIFVRPAVLEELKRTYLRTHVQTELRFTSQMRVKVKKEAICSSGSSSTNV